jgi:hemophore-related protein
MASARLLRSVVIVGGVMAVVSLSQTATSSADPITAQLVNTTCSYAQLSAALNVASPSLASQLKQRPDMQANLQQFIAMSVDQRQESLAQQQAMNPKLEALITAQIGPQITQVANTCMNY